ncbi:C2 domain-containing protein [Blastocladiella britannica]|nr:C2 domain-containing protein [Blastocladiella britannica]
MTISHIDKIECTIYSAKHLKDDDFVGKSDPYVYIKCGMHSKKTKVVSGSTSPTWDEVVIIDGEGLIGGSTLEIAVYDHDTLTFDDALGHVSIPLDSLRNGRVEGHYKLQQKHKSDYKGELHAAFLATGH